MFQRSLLIIKPYVVAIVAAKVGALTGFGSLMIDSGIDASVGGGGGGGDFDFVIEIIYDFLVRLRFVAV